MTTREEGKKVSRQIETQFKRDVLVQLLWQHTTAKRRRELVSSAKSSLTSHISRKLLLEEHKLEIQLEQIEKERKQFLKKNNNEKHILQLSVRSIGGKGTEGREKFAEKSAKRSQNAMQRPRPRFIQRRYSQGIAGR